MSNVGSNGNYWTFAPNSQTNARNLNFTAGNVNPLNNNNRANGFSVRSARELGRRGEICFTTITMRYGYGDIHTLVTEAYLDARRRERSTRQQLAFEADLERGIASLASSLAARRWRPSPMEWFVLDRPTIREVFAPSFGDRIVSHMLFNLISPIFERYFIHDSYSCRKGKGTLYGIERFEHHVRSVTDNYRREAWCLNIDISGYFMSIDRSRLFAIISRRLAAYAAKHPDEIDYDFALWLSDSYLSRDPLAGCRFIGRPCLIPLVAPNKSLFSRPPGIGVPIGDVVNQLNSNIYLNELDQFAKRSLGARHYCRYVDDVRILREDRNELLRDKVAIAEFLSTELGLTIHPEKTTITSLADTNYFLGAAIRPYRRYARNSAISSFRKSVGDMEHAAVAGNLGDPESALAILNSHLGYLSHFREWKTRKRIIDSAPALSHTFTFDDNFTKAKIKRV